MSGINNITKSLTETLKQSDLKGLTAEYGEVFLDSFLAEGIAKDIPILNSIIAAFKTTASVKDMLFAKKIVRFLTQINDIPEEEREKMINEIDGSQKNRIKIGEKLLYILDKCDDHEKAELVGILFKAFLQNKISYSDFLLCNLVIEKCIISELEVFVLDEVIEYNVEEYSEYLNWGLVNFAPFNIDIQKVNGSSYQPEYELKGKKLSLTTSNAGNILRDTLKKQITQSVLGEELCMLPVNDVEEYLRTILAKYENDDTYGMLWQVRMVCAAQLCRNANVSYEEYEKFIKLIVADNLGQLKFFENYISRYARRMLRENIVFDRQKWQNFYSKLFTAKGHVL
ncbi:hypothetical protein [Flavobacterium panacagri]|uniref:hypothetical protein n=1 Tax=Flavobacterium panacagri TaxID=3034146 RepID=UPI0025A67158|nr:hypothetical protein [Flavobacterium panacagri]